MTGRDKMPLVLQHATNDIKHHLWRLYDLVLTIGCRNIVELGVRSGDSTRSFLCGAQDHGGCKVHSYDIAGDAYRVREVTERYGIPWEWDDIWTCDAADSAEASGLPWRTVYALPPDLVFIDTDHSLKTTRREIAAWAPLVAVGGCLVFHDVDLNEPGRDGVRPAMLELQAAHPQSWKMEEHIYAGEGDTGLGILWRMCP